MMDVMSSVSSIEVSTNATQDYGLAPDVVEFLRYANAARVINLSARAILITMGIVSSICASGLLWKRRSCHSLGFTSLVMNMLLTCIVHFGYNLIVDTIYLSNWFEYRKGGALCRLDAFLLYICKMALVYQIIALLVFTISNKIKPSWIRALNNPKSVISAAVGFWITVLACNIHRLATRGLVHVLGNTYCAPLTESHAPSYFLFVAHFLAIILIPCIVLLILGGMLWCARRFKETDIDPSTYSQYRKLSISLVVLVSVSHIPIALYHLVLLCGGHGMDNATLAVFFIKDLLLFSKRLYSTFIPVCILVSFKHETKMNKATCSDQITLLERQDFV